MQDADLKGLIVCHFKVGSPVSMDFCRHGFWFMESLSGFCGICLRVSLLQRGMCVNETGDMFTPAEHFCMVAAINHEVVDEKQRQMLALK